nr:ASCH domain-containing protein [Demequina phytophila]
MPGLPEAEPEAWCFGWTAGMADGLLELVLAGVKTGTASSLQDYEDEGETVPEAGSLSIVLDGRGQPRALIEAVRVEVVPFDQVTAEHAASEGEGDRTLAYWRTVHEDVWRRYSARGFSANMPVVCERFRLVRTEADPRP